MRNANCAKKVLEETVSDPLEGAEISIGRGFQARSFRAREIGDVMDPLVMVDHYVMTASTFGVHPHAGLSAVTLLFENSEGLFHNRDSLGNDLDLQPGDLYWLKAGRGAIHDEAPRRDSRAHGLQVFVNVPRTQRFESPDSLLVRAKDMPVINSAAYRVRVALGESNGVTGAVSPSLPMTILDGVIQAGGYFSHAAHPNRGIWIQAIDGPLDVWVDKNFRSLKQGEAIAISTELATRIESANTSSEPVHFVMFDGPKIGESYIHEGPFVMDTKAQIEDIQAAYEAGRLGDLSNHN